MINPDEITSQNNLQKGLNVKPEVLPTKFPEAPKIEVPSLKTEKYDPLTQQFLKDQSGLLQQKTQVDVDTARNKLAMDAANLGLKSNVEKQYATDIRSDIDANQLKKDEYPRPEFHPTKENLASLGALFSMVSTLGMIVGSSGKMGANNAMNAMTGMLKGWQTGRKDLYEKEVKEFDKEYKRITDLRNEIEKQLEKSIQLRGIDKEASYAAGQQAIALAGTNSVLGNMLNKGNVEGALKLLDSGLNLEFKVKESKQKEEELRLKRIQNDKRNNEILVKPDGSVTVIDKNTLAMTVFPADSAFAQNVAGAQKIGAKDSNIKVPKEIVQAHILRENLIPKIEEALPILDRLNKEGKWNTLTTLLKSQDTAGFNQAEWVFKDDPQAIDLIRTLAFFRSKEFETAGKALTKTENQILSSLYQSGARPFEAVNNNLLQSLSQLNSEQLKLERQYPNLQSGAISQIQTRENFPTITTQAEFDALPEGSVYIEGDKKYTKPRKQK
jgi:hypothetical protein